MREQKKLELVLERKGQQNKTAILAAGATGPVAMITPPIDEEYWTYRVQLGGGQAVVGFPKFSTIGIGFAKEKDWNTNLPYTCGTDEIYQHIRHNAGRSRATPSEIKKAIKMIQDAAIEDRPQDKELRERLKRQREHHAD